VGDATAAAARTAGFAKVASADGDLDALADLIAAQATGLVLAPGPREPAGDLPRALAAQGVTARALALYETLPVFPRNAIGGLGQVDAVLVHSPKAGERLATVLGGKPGPAAYCISAAAAAPLAGQPFAEVRWAEHPDEDSLLKLLPSPNETGP